MFLRRLGHHRIVAALLLSAVALLVFHKLTLHPTDLLVGPQDHGRSDVTKHSLPSRAFPWSTIREGEAPFWHNNGLLGSPWLGNPQSAMFYPPNWIFALGADPTTTLSWFVVLHHWFGGLGVYVLARHYRVSFAGSMLGGIVFLAAPFLIAQTGEGHSTQTCLVAWAPWAFLVYGRLRRGDRGSTAWMVVILAMAFFCGHVQECFFLVLLLSFFVAADLFNRREHLLPTRALALRWLMIGGLTAGLCAIELTPNWIYTKNAVRNGGMDAVAAGRISAGPLNFLQLIDPYVLGGPDNYRGPGEFYWETLCYFGIASLLLAFVAIAGGTRKRRWMRRWTLVAVGTFLFALGTDTPLFGLMHRFVPGVSLFRSPSRALFFTSLAVALLAGGGFDVLATWMRRRSVGSRRVVLGVAGALAVALLVGSLLFGGPASALADRQLADNIAWESALKSLEIAMPLVWLGLALIAVAALACQPRWLPVAATIFGLSLVTDFSVFAHRTLETAPMSSLRRDNDLAELLKKESLQGRVLVEQDLLSDREALSSGIEKLRRYDPVPTARTGLLCIGLAPDLDPAGEITGFNPLLPDRYQKPLLDMLNVTHLAFATGDPPQLDGWELIAQGEMPEELTLRGRKPRTTPYAVYRNQTSMPRAYTVASSRRITIDQAKQALGSFDPRYEMLSESNLPQPSDKTPFRPAKVVKRTANTMVIEVETETPTQLVIAESFYPGWTATIDGSPTSIEPGNVALRSIAIPAGSHRVELIFFPPGLRLGTFMSLLALATLLVGAFKRQQSTLPKARRRETTASQPLPAFVSE